MSTTKIDISSLTLEQRVLLEQRLREKRGRAVPRPTIAHRQSTAPAPLSFAQRRLWFLSQLEPDSAFYNGAATVRLSGRLDVGALEAALDEIARRHEVLRTVFALEEGVPVQVVKGWAATSLPLFDLSALPVERAEAEAARLCEEEAQRPFDLAAGPLTRARLLRLRDDEHVLLLALHHIVGDGWSIGVCMRELAALYEAFASGRPSPLAELPIQYADFADWQNRWLQGEACARQLSYWEQRLADVPPLLHLPTDRPRPAVQSFRGACEPFALSQELADELRALSRAEEATLFMTLLAAFQALLYRYTGQSQVVTGSPVAGRNWSETEGLIGCFLNLLVLRTDLSGDPTFRQLLGRVREVTVGAMAHQEVPFEKLVEELQPERDLSRNPLFQVMFALQNVPRAETRLAGLRMSVGHVDSGMAKVDLYLSIEDGEELKAALEYSADLFDAATARRMAGHFRNLLQAAAADPERRLSELPLMDEAERDRLLVRWNETRTEYRREACLHQLFEEQAALSPDRVAVAFEGERLTYGQLNRRANQLARYLRRLGVGPEVRVGICARRSIEMVVGLLGVLKAGGAYVPLDPNYPQERLSFMMEDARARVLLTQESLAGLFPDSAARVILLDQDPFGAENEENTDFALGADNLAYVIYTSGSTGRPKGVQIPHGAVVNFLSSMAKEPGLTGDDVLLAVTSLSFDIAGLEIFLPLVTGARLEIASREVASDGVQLLELLERSGATIMQATPATWRLMLEAGWRDARGLKVLCGGEALPPELAKQLLTAGATLWNMYGPTETTIWSAVEEVESGDGVVPIGRPIANTSLYLLDELQQPVPVGVVGELYIGGEGLARGYLNRPALTAEKFVPNPWDGGAGGRLYRTGDSARYLPNGDVECLGRQDQQVKVRGFRIELGEIEAVLSQHEGVREAAVAAFPAQSGGRELAAYVVTTRAMPVFDELRGFLAGKLPEYMIPTAFMTVESLPLTPNGKVDRKALPPPDRSRALPERSYVAPRTPTEEILATICADVLGVERVGIHDSFFELGGHSLLAMQVVARVREVFKVELPVRRLFEQTTVAGLARYVETQLKEGRSEALVSLRPVERGADLPLSFAQQRLWFLEQLEPGTPDYNVPAAARLTGHLDVQALEHALTEIVRRHESLRTTFISADGEPRQLIHAPLAVALPLTDLSDLPAEQREAEAMKVAEEQARRPFDLARGPLLRLSLLRLSEQEHLFLLTMHHIVSDGWSSGVIIRELAALYRAFSAGEPSPLEELPIQYADYAVWQREWLQGEALEEQLEYWRQQLAGAPPVLELPTDRPRPAVQSHRGAREVVELDEGLVKRLREVGSGEGATLFMVLLAAFQLLLSRYSGQQDIPVGTPVANRTRAETENLIGFFTSTLVLRTQLDDGLSFRELLGRVRETCLEAYQHQDVPFETLVEQLRPERSLSHSPLFQVMFALQNTPLPKLELGDLSLSVQPVDRGGLYYDLLINFIPTECGLKGTLEYSADLFDAATARRMAGHFRNLLQAAAADPERRLSELPLMDEAERRQVVDGWNQTRVDYPQRFIHQLVEEQVARTPEAVAVHFESECLTYEELNRRANRLARHLRALGVGPDVVVGICVGRSPEMLVGLLAVLKAGGCYLPLDPNYPRERLSFMLSDACAPLILTQERLLDLLGEHGPKAVCLDNIWDEIAGYGDENVEPPLSPANLAYVIYTSGSTGRPKGTGLTQLSLSNLLRWHLSELLCGARTLQFASLSFDVSFYEAFTAWCSGGTLFVVGEGVRHDLRALAGYIAGHRIAKAVLPVVMLQQLAEEYCSGDYPELCLAEITATGEALYISTPVVNFYKRFAGCELHNQYGPSETHIITAYKLEGDPESWERYPPLGGPIPNARVYLLDPALNPVPVGVAGELYIGGDSVGRGYVNRPGLTAERFLPDPFGPAGGRLYRSGDLARFRPDGNIEFLGRVDHQIKIRGLRVELGEIEAVLAQHPGVRETIVTTQVAADGDKRLVAYVAGEKEQLPARSELLKYLKERLPDYMIPSWVIILEAFPLNPNGKVDRRRLPAPDHSRPELDVEFGEPRTPAEQLVARIWADLIGVERVGLNDNFFDLGGHSLLATKVMFRVQNVFSAELPLSRVFESPTVAGLVEAIGEACGGREIADAVAETYAEVERLSAEEARAMIPLAAESFGPSAAGPRGQES